MFGWRCLLEERRCLQEQRQCLLAEWGCSLAASRRLQQARRLPERAKPCRPLVSIRLFSRAESPVLKQRRRFCYLPRMWVPPPPRGGVVSDVGIAPGGILEDSLSSGLCSSLEAGCCSVIGTTLAYLLLLALGLCVVVHISSCGMRVLLVLGGQPMSMLPPSRGGLPSLGWGGVTAIFFLAALSFRCEEEFFFFILDTLPAPVGCSWLPQRTKNFLLSDTS